MQLLNEEVSSLILADVKALSATLDRLWRAAQMLPPGHVRTEIEATHQSIAQLTLNLHMNVLENMVASGNHSQVIPNGSVRNA